MKLITIQFLLSLILAGLSLATSFGTPFQRSAVSVAGGTIHRRAPSIISRQSLAKSPNNNRALSVLKDPVEVEEAENENETMDSTFGEEEAAAVASAFEEEAFVSPIQVEELERLFDHNMTEEADFYYNWKEFLPKGNGVGGVFQKLRWLITGSSMDYRQSNTDLKKNLSALAKILILLRFYEHKFGVPTFCGQSEQRKLLSDITMDLYSSGTPTWVLEPVMERVAEGMTGGAGVQLMLLPRRCFFYFPGSDGNMATTAMFKISPGYDIARMGAVEQVAVRLASFASNTKSSERLNPAAFRMPSKGELYQAKKKETSEVIDILNQENPSKEELSEEILNLASSTYGLFFFLNSPTFQKAINATDEDDVFWEVKNSTRDTFTRLATDAASKSMDGIKANQTELYSKPILSLCRVLSSAGACAMWFGGSVPDMIVSGILALAVHRIGTSRTLAFEERVLTEVVSSFVVGLCAGLLAIRWPDTFCFGAIAIASVMDLMQGFKVSYGVIEVMSKNIVTGAARLLEGILFTGLVSYSIKFGLDFAFRLVFGQSLAPNDYSGMLVATNGISEKFFPLLLPFTATAWSTLFWPSHKELPWMAAHGMLAYSLNLAGMPTFLAAMCVTFSAGVISRFTGRGALGNTLAGLYALVPGSYMATTLLAPNKVGFIESVLSAAATIGVGGWTGTLLCSPTILGKTSGLHGWAFNRKDKQRQSQRPDHLLYF